jgi:hypothetical protein
VARGFDSKNVEWQQQQAEDARAARGRPKLDKSPEQRALLERRRSLELALARTRADLEKATRPQHRELLQRSLAALERELRSLEPGA